MDEKTHRLVGETPYDLERQTGKTYLRISVTIAVRPNAGVVSVGIRLNALVVLVILRLRIGWRVSGWIGGRTVAVDFACAGRLSENAGDQCAKEEHIV